MNRKNPGTLEKSSAIRMFALTVCVTCVLMLQTGCGDKDGPTEPPREPPRAAAISVSPDSVTLSKIGETADFTANIKDQYGAAFSGAVTWASDSPDVFTVAANGTATAVGNGSGMVSATHESLRGMASVTVNESARAASISVSPDSVTLTSIGETATFTAIIKDQFDQSFDGSVTWSSDASEVFTVDEGGVVTAVAGGSGTVTATHDSLSATGSVTVDVPVNLPPMAKGTLLDYLLAAGGGPRTYQPQAHFEDPDNDIFELTYTSMVGDSAIASTEIIVDVEKHVVIVIQGLTPGMTTVTVTATDPGGLSAVDTHAVLVDESGFTPLTGIAIDVNRIIFEDLNRVISAACSQPIRDLPLATGNLHSVNTSKWQTRSDPEGTWEDVADTEKTTGQICTLAPTNPGEYRLVFNMTVAVDEHISFTGDYRSKNTFTVEAVAENRAPEVLPDLPTFARLSVGGGPGILSFATTFIDPDGDALTFSGEVADSSLVALEIVTDSSGHAFFVSRGLAVGRTTATAVATDPGGLTAENTLTIEVDGTGYTPDPTIMVSNGVLHTFGLDVPVCLPPVIDHQLGEGRFVTIHTSKWQTLSDPSEAWTDVEGTEKMNGQLCPYATDVPGEYRLVYESSTIVDEHIPEFRGRYRADNTFTVPAGE